MVTANRAMYTHFDPEGNVSVLADGSALTLSIPCEQNVHLYASFDTAWEQTRRRYDTGVSAATDVDQADTLRQNARAHTLCSTGWDWRPTP